MGGVRDPASAPPLVGTRVPAASGLRHRAALPSRAVIEIRAGPFAGFREVVAFQRRIASLHGVQRVEIVQFVAMRVMLRVNYAGVVPLAMHLAELQDDHLEMAVLSSTRIEIRVRAGP